MNKVLLMMLMLWVIVFAGCMHKTPTPVLEQPDEIMEDENELVDPAEEGSDEMENDNPNLTAVEINAEASIVNRAGERIVGNKHKGTVVIKNGTALYDEGQLVWGQATIDMSTIVGDNPMADKHLMSADFFDVETYPEAKIMLKNVTANESGELTATADLTIKGITNEVVFPVVESDGTLTMSISIDRTLRDIRYDSGKFFLDLGDKAIRDEITFEVIVVLAQ